MYLLSYFKSAYCNLELFKTLNQNGSQISDKGQKSRGSEKLITFGVFHMAGWS